MLACALSILLIVLSNVVPLTITIEGMMPSSHKRDCFARWVQGNTWFYACIVKQEERIVACKNSFRIYITKVGVYRKLYQFLTLEKRENIQ